MGRLDDIKARLAAATPGPWHDESDWPRVFAGGANVVAQCCPRIINKYKTGPTADTALIANAPADLAWLVKCVEHQARRLACTDCAARGCDTCCPLAPTQDTSN